MATSTSVRGPSRNAQFARISAVQQMIGASGFTDASPVIIPTCSEPKSRHKAKNFSLTNALIGAVYTLRLPAANAAKWAAVATRALPDPVGVLRIT